MEATGIGIRQALSGDPERRNWRRSRQASRPVPAKRLVVEFNLASPKQHWARWLFRHPGAGAQKIAQRQKTGWSTDAAVGSKKTRADHPVVPLVLEHRTLSKLKSTYCGCAASPWWSQENRPRSHRLQPGGERHRTALQQPSHLQNIPIAHRSSAPHPLRPSCPEAGS